MAELGWDARLSRVLSPPGQRLVTLRDAANYIAGRFANVTRNAALEHAIELLMEAAESGALEDRKRATDQLARFLAGER
jgi:hypothetical protein